jgi:hypothetical protein
MEYKELKLDTEAFLKTEYGKYLIRMLNEMQASYLSDARDVNNSNPMRCLDKSTAIQEVINSIESPLE